MRLRGLGFFAAVCAALFFGSAAQAQYNLTQPPIRPIMDERDVNLRAGLFSATRTMLSIGDPAKGGLSYSVTYRDGSPYDASTDAWIFQCSSLCIKIGQRMINNYEDLGPGEFFINWSYAPDGEYSLKLFLQDGTTYVFHSCSIDSQAAFPTASPDSVDCGFPAWLDRIEKPGGEIVKYNRKIVQTTGPYKRIVSRLQSVTNNFGYMLQFEYASNVTPVGYGDWAWLTDVVRVWGINNAIDACAPLADTCSTVGPHIDYSNGHQAITDWIGRTFAVTRAGPGLSIATVNYPEGNTATISRFAWMTESPQVQTITNSLGQTWTYDLDNAAWWWDCATCGFAAAVTDPTGRVTFVGGSWLGLTTVTGTASDIASIEYNSAYRQTWPTKFIYPEGNSVELIYDSRGNIIKKITAPKVGTERIYENADYDATCTTATRFTCNQPNWVKGPASSDGGGAQTVFTYDPAHGGLLTVTGPPPSSGAVQPQVRTTYDAKHARYKNGSGAFIDDPNAVNLPVTISQCATASSCIGDMDKADEVVTSVAYGASGAANNLSPTSVTVHSGDDTVTATTSFGYDYLGNRATAVDPMGATTRFIYDGARRLVGSIGPDPDGTGPLKHRALRNTYNSGSQITLAEVGTTNGQSDTDWSGFATLQQESSSYDSEGHPLKRAFVASATTQSLVQFSYDAAGRLECSTVRMNPAVFSALPPSACTLSTTGDGGPDRITKTTYDANSRPSITTSAYGTSAEQVTSTTSFSANGQLTSLTDANGNVTAYTYDSFDRLVKTRYPCPTTGTPCSGGDAFPRSSSTDFEALTLNAVGNVLTRTLRYNSAVDGGSGPPLVTYSYDALNRETSGMMGVATTYDNLNRVKTRTFNGQTLTFNYDALGRQTSEVGPNGTVARTFDPAGRRKTLSAPNYGVNYDYLATGELKYIKDGAGAVLVTYDYDDLGRRTKLTRANGVTTEYSYAASGALRQLKLDHNGTTYDQTVDFIRNAAGQIINRAAANSQFDPLPRAISITSFNANGLNQLTTPSNSLTYDGRGNLTADPFTTYRYDLANRLTNVNDTATTLSYDGMSRLVQLTSGASTTKFLYDGSNLIEELDAGGSVKAEYVHGAGTDEPLIWYDFNANLHKWLTADQQGSIVAITDGSGDLASVGGALGLNAYDEYGVRKESNVGRFQYTGQVWLPEAGVYYYKARVYSPLLGRFLQTDPIGMKDDFNLYAYVGGDPINANDPFGLERDTTTLECPDGSTGICGTDPEGSTAGTDGDVIVIIGHRRPRMISYSFNGYGSSSSSQSLTLEIALEGKPSLSIPQQCRSAGNYGFSYMMDRTGDVHGSIYGGAAAAEKLAGRAGTAAKIATAGIPATVGLAVAGQGYAAVQDHKNGMSWGRSGAIHGGGLAGGLLAGFLAGEIVEPLGGGFVGVIVAGVGAGWAGGKGGELVGGTVATALGQCN